jgi:hypothetical protein
MITNNCFIETVIDHIEEPLSVGGITRQSNLLGATLWRLGLSNINKRQIRPVNWSGPSAPIEMVNGWLCLLSSFVTGAGTQRRTGGRLETMAGIVCGATRVRM